VVQRLLLNSALALAAVIFTLALAEGSSYFFRFPLHLSIFEFNPPPKHLRPLASYLPAPELDAAKADLLKARRYSKKEREDLIEMASRLGVDYSAKLKFFPDHSVVRIQQNGPVIYDVSVVLDKYGRRNASRLELKKEPALVLLGDSFVYGEGLSEWETTAQIMQQIYPKRPIYNLGISGLGPNDLLRKLETESENFFAGVPLKGSTVIFLYNSALSARANCNLSTYVYPHLHFIQEKPYYSLKSDGSLEYLGTCGSLFFRDLLFRLLSHSNFLEANYIDWPPRQARYPRQLVAKILIEARRLLVEKLGAKRMVVVAYPYPEGEIEHELVSLRESGLELLDLSSLDIESATQGDAEIPTDHHPSPSAAVILAHIISYNFPPGR
jgi:hypothetical protein